MPEARVIASAQGGLPILVERNKGRGRCLLFAIPADNAWGEWAIHPLFLPLVHQVAGYAELTVFPAPATCKKPRRDRALCEPPGVTIANGRAVVRNVDSGGIRHRNGRHREKLREFYRLPEASGEDASPERSRPLEACRRQRATR